MTANRLKKHREDAGLTQTHLAELCGWGPRQSRIANYERGVSNPSLTDCRILVAALNRAGLDCTLDDVFPPEADSEED